MSTSTPTDKKAASGQKEKPGIIKENKKDLELTDEEVDFVCDAIITHMGPWTKNYKGEEVLSPPTTKYQRFVHMCDYLASRKFLDIKFDKNNNIKDE